jgi:hypothetical protein
MAQPHAHLLSCKLWSETSTELYGPLSQGDALRFRLLVSQEDVQYPSRFASGAGNSAIMQNFARYLLRYR